MDDNQDQPEDVIESQEVEKDIETPDDHEEPAEEVEDTLPKQKARKKKGWLARFKRKKKVTIPLALFLIIAVILAIPLSRYKVLGLVLKRSVDITVKDSKTNNPITEATVTIAGQKASTDKNGLAHISNVPVGPHAVTISKSYYTDASVKVLVKIRSSTNADVQITATGRQVPLTVINKITHTPLENVLIKASDTQARTDKDGKAIMVLPADKTTVDVSLSLEGYNNLTTKVQVTETNVPANDFQLVSAGKLYFLSKLSGKIDVVKTDLDGSNRKTVLAGTGKEDDQDTVLLASRDWKYLALKSKRDGGANAKLFLIETATDKLTTIDQGNATFTLSGWSNHRFIYSVFRNTVKIWQSKQTALKSFNADDKQLATLDETTAEGKSDMDYANSTIDSVYILADQIVYNRVWQSNFYSSGRIKGKQMSIMVVNPDGTGKRAIKNFTASYNNYINTSLYKPEALYFDVHIGSADQFYELEDGTVKTTTEATTETFQKVYPTFLISPSGKHTFWAEPRDGKNSLFVGDQTAEQQANIDALSSYNPYGWYTGDYLLVSKGGSELFIMPVAGATRGGKVIKVADYHKPALNFNGYGGGYGGL